MNIDDGDRPKIQKCKSKRKCGIESYRLVTDLEPKHADAYHELRCSYAELGRYKELAPHTNVK